MILQANEDQSSDSQIQTHESCRCIRMNQAISLPLNFMSFLLDESILTRHFAFNFHLKKEQLPIFHIHNHEYCQINDTYAWFECLPKYLNKNFEKWNNSEHQVLPNNSWGFKLLCPWIKVPLIQQDRMP